MKAFKSRVSSRPSPEAALAAAAVAAPQQPPATVGVTESDRTTTLNLRVKEGTIRALVAAARERGMTQKQVIVHALQAAGVRVAAADLEDRTPRRQS